MEPKGYFCLVLHAHLPFVRHPEHDIFMEEDWLYEAITETYIPLINVFDGLVNEGVDFRVTMSITPPLMNMLADPLLQDRYVRYISRLCELADKEVERTRWQPEFQNTALMYQRKLNNARHVFVDKYGKNILSAFKKFQDRGNLEVITCTSTHGFLPLMPESRSAVRAQIQVAVDTYAKHMGRRPRGIWLAECGYNPGDDELLKEYGIRYFFVDTHGVLYATPRPKYGTFAPIYCKSGVAAFGRDIESSKQVWSAKEGYPGDYNYREFYRDIGWDLDLDYIGSYLHGDGIRSNIGIKYYRITGTTDNKEPYIEANAMEKAAEHAGNFLFNREKQAEYLSGVMDRKPIIVAPYDAELFGHWWYEGPDFINFLFRKMHYDQENIKPITPSEYLEKYPRNQVSTPCMSSWGYKGYNEFWLNGSNDWVYRHLHKSSERMSELANMYPNAHGIVERALNQAARELLLAQSSDWAFIMKTGTTVQYAVKRTKDHIGRFTRLYEDIKGNRIDEGWLGDIEAKDNIFSEINYRVYIG